MFPPILYVRLNCGVSGLTHLSTHGFAWTHSFISFWHCSSAWLVWLSVYIHAANVIIISIIYIWSRLIRFSRGDVLFSFSFFATLHRSI